MRHFTLYIVFLITVASCRTKTTGDLTAAYSTHYSRSLAYVRGTQINYFFKGSGLNGRLPNCYDPDISPAGSQLAFTEYYKSKNPNAAGSNRRIAILNAKTGIQRLIEIDSEQSCRPVWSPNGQRIAFSYFDKEWNIAIADTQNVIKVIKHTSRGYHGLSWAPDNQMIFAHDLDTLYFIDTSGAIIQKLSIQTITSGQSKSSSTVFTLTADKQFLVFNGSNSQATFYPDNEYRANMPDALYKYNLKDKTLQKLTPDDMNCVDYKISGDSIFYSAVSRENKSITHVYKMSVNEPKFSQFIKNGHSISVTQQNGL